jgi:protein-S-isoprenylcysteine O-methyltransferase Ste14
VKRDRLTTRFYVVGGLLAVLLVLVGVALVLRSRPHLEWALLFFLLNAVYIPLLEEPLLRERFGEEYQEYCRHVPRLVPRLRAWAPRSS